MMARPLATPPPTTVSAWLRQSATSGAVSSWDNVLNAGNPAVQGTAARRPTAGADFALTFDGGDDLAWVIDAANANATAMGFAIWIKLGSVSGAQTIIAIRNLGNPDGASSTMLELRTSGTALQLDMFSDGTNGRRASVSGVLSTSSAILLTVEFNGVLGTEAAREVITINTVVQTLSFSNLGTGGTLTSLTPGVTGNINIGSRSGLNLPISAGTKYGRNLFANTAAMSGVTEGVWTAAARTAMFDFEALT
jgi:hypothetical protein